MQSSLKLIPKKNIDLSPKVNPSELMSALLQITIETDETTDKLRAPMVPNWNLSPSPIPNRQINGTNYKI